MKKTITVLLLLAMLLSLAACGGGTPADPDAPDDPAVETKAADGTDETAGESTDTVDVEAILAQADALGISKAALELLRDASEKNDDLRLWIAYRKLNELQWKEATVTSSRDGLPLLIQEYTYNADGTDCTEKETQYDGNGTLMFINYKHRILDKAENVLEEIWYDDEGPEYSLFTTMEYNSDGQVTRQISYDEDGNLIMDEIRDYDEHGNLLYLYEDNNNYYMDLEQGISNYSFQHYDCKNEYDADGNLIRVTQVGKDGAVQKTVEHEYDANGKRIKTNNYDGNGALTTYIEYTYNEAGREIRQFTYYPDGSIRKGRERDYSADNRFLIKDITYTEGGAFQESAEWTYDENGCAKTCDRRYADESENYILEYEWVFFPLQ